MSAFILPVILLPLREGRRNNSWIQYCIPGLIGIAFLTLLGIHLNPGEDISGEGLELLSGWNFSTTESVAALTIRADPLSLSFLILVLIALLAVTLLRSGPLVEQKEQALVTGWLAMGAAACFVFVSANGLTLIYATLAFDTFVAFYWLGRDQRDWGIAHLFLGIFTAASLMLATLAPTTGIIPGILFLGLALWLRLGLYLFLAITSQIAWHDDEKLVYQTLSLITGIYLIIRMVSGPLPEVVRWLAAITMLFSGLLTWLIDPYSSSPNINTEPQTSPSTQSSNSRIQVSLLSCLILTEVLLILVAELPALSVTVPFAFGIVLSFIALWVTPALGRPRFNERAWSWPYLPAVMATFTVLGLPLLLGWLSKGAIYQSLFQSGNNSLTLTIIVAECFALSGLVRYWHILLRGTEMNNRRSVVGVVVMVPFLTPGLASLLLLAITGTNLSSNSVELLPEIVLTIGGIIIAAVSLGLFRDQIIQKLRFPSKPLIELLCLNWLLDFGQILCGRLSRSILRIGVILEGQFYISWALFMALIGALIILLG